MSRPSSLERVYQSPWIIGEQPRRAREAAAPALGPIIGNADFCDLGALLFWRQGIVDRTLYHAEPRTEARFGTASASAEFHNPMLNEPILNDFRRMGELGTAHRQFRQARPLLPPNPAWEPLTGVDQLTRPGLPPMSSSPQLDALPQTFTEYADSMAHMQRSRRALFQQELEMRQRQTGNA